MIELAKLAQVLASPSRLRIVEELMRGPQTAKELAVKLSLSPVTIHHHLPWLVRAGIIERAPPLRSGHPGRPTSRFRLSSETLRIQLPPRDYQALSKLLVGILSEVLGPTATRKQLRTIGAALGKQLGATYLQKTGSEQWSLADFRRHVVEGHCAERGFVPEVVSEKPRSLQFRLHNCLVLEVAREHPDVVCSLDGPMMESLARTTLGKAEVEQLGCMAHGAPCCEYLVKRTK